MGKFIIALLIHDDGRYAGSALKSWFDGLAKLHPEGIAL